MSIYAYVEWLYYYRTFFCKRSNSDLSFFFAIQPMLVFGPAFVVQLCSLGVCSHGLQDPDLAHILLQSALTTKLGNTVWG